MKNSVRIGTVLLTLASGIGLAAAQGGPAGGQPGGQTPQTINSSSSSTSHINLSPAQKTAILGAVRQEGAKITPSTNLVATVGATVPTSIELHALPNSAVATAPEARNFKYTMVQNQLVLVDPTTMKVVDVIQQ